MLIRRSAIKAVTVILAAFLCVLAGFGAGEAVALTNNVVLRWPDPQGHGYASSLVKVRYSSDDFPGSAILGAEAYTGTNQMVNHTGLTAGITNYYSIFVTDDEETFVAPE
jgi:hypothetical protein